MKNQSSNYQIVLFLLGENGSGKSWVADSLVRNFDFSKKISFNEFLINLISDVNIFNIPKSQLSSDNIDTPFNFALQVKEANVRRLLNKVGQLLPVYLGFNPSRIAISNFNFPKVNSPRELLNYVIYDFFNRLNPDYLTTLVYQGVIGKPGIYVVDDLMNSNQFNIGMQNFQMVYTCLVDLDKRKLKKKKNENLIDRVENDAIKIYPDYKILNEFDEEKTKASILEMVNKLNHDVSEKTKKGNIKPLSNSVNEQANDWNQSKGPLSKNINNNKVYATDKATFVRVNTEHGDLTSSDRIRDYHVRSQL